MPRLSGSAGPVLLAIAALGGLVVTLAIVPDTDPIGPALAALVATLGAAVCAGGILVAALSPQDDDAVVGRMLRLATGGTVAWSLGSLAAAVQAVDAAWAVTTAVAATAAVLCAATRHAGLLAAVAVAALAMPAALAARLLAPGLIAGVDAGSVAALLTVVLALAAGVALARTRLGSESATPHRTFLLAVALLAAGLALGALVATVHLLDGVGTVDPSTATPAEYLTGRPLPPEPTFDALLLQWRVDAVALVAIAGLVVLVAVGARRRRAVHAWHPARAVAFALAVVLLLWTTSGAPAVYADTLFSAHASRYALLVAVIPLLLTLATSGRVAVAAFAPRTDGSRGVGEWLAAARGSRAARVATHPLLTVALGALAPWVLSFTPLLRASVAAPVLGHALDAVVLAIGCAATAALFGRRLAGRPARASTRLALAAILVASWALAAVTLGLGTGLLAADWFGATGRDGGWGALADQRIGGAGAWGIAALAALPALLSAAIDAARGRGAQPRPPRPRRTSTQLDAYDALLARRGGDAQ